MDYDEMLEKGREEVPEDVGGGERFEIPEADTQKDGSKTVIRNFGALADRFNREREHLSKFLLGELGTSGHVEGNELVLNGSFRRGKINGKLEEYAEKYVICSECGRPDTELEKEKGVELLKCEACGARNPLEE
ncbi:MAG: translation initiation factor IF-2 subunit beta [Candidatus Nanohaloarchaea archaeon]|nr:translation initiation factor IF-2 subunit beta [Candidatus Nanohaloarchaea archaeon]